MYPSSQNPGYGSFVKEQVNSLVAQGIEIKIVASSENRKGFRYTLPKYFSLVINSLLAVIQEKYDIIHAHYIFPTGIIGCLASIIRKSKLIITIHSSLEPHCKSYISKKSIQYSLHKASHIITVGQSVANELIRDFLVNPSKISLVDMGVDTDLFQPVPIKKARELLGLPKEKTILICVGNLIWRKGFHFLLSSMGNYPEVFRNILTIIIGGGPLYATLQNLVKQYHLSEQVHFAGVMDKKKIPLWLSAADYLVHPSLDEGFGLAIVEAMSCEKIVIASPVGGVIDFLQDGVNGYFIKPWNCGVRSEWENWLDEINVKSLAESINYVLSIPERQKKIVRKNARMTAEGHDIHLQASKVKSLYSQICASPPK